jgi:hypothetical protein
VPHLLSRTQGAHLLHRMGKHQPDERLPNEKVQKQIGYRKSHHPEYHQQHRGRSPAAAPRNAGQGQYFLFHQVEKLFHDNPDMSAEELEKIMYQYEQARVTPSRQSKPESTYGDSDRRAPIRPRESMKDILYNGVGVGEEKSNRAGSRVRADDIKRNNYNLRP